ncbi:hypothetical protein [Myxococcus eversor]|uniref:hypothetical protein n=1 Tax=Myxococcus eversor TaxID=2709661 RepID=UPI0013D7697A|nr:hypothetical protein [Myxococcus eversor]
MKNGWRSAGVFAVAMAVCACGGTEEDVAREQVPAAGIQEAQPGDTHQQSISCDAAGRCPPGFYCDVTWTCRYVGGHG